jgi:hypothetical protein
VHALVKFTGTPLLLYLLALSLGCSTAWRHGLSLAPGLSGMRFVSPADFLTLHTDPGPFLLQVPPKTVEDLHPMFRAESRTTSSMAQAPDRGDEESMRQVRSGLSPEQGRLVGFIADRYRVAGDLVSEVVSAAYEIAREHKLDPLLVLAVVAVESRFDPLAQSPRGAQGLMQVLTRVHAKRFEAFGGVATVFDPITNLRVGVAILSEYLRRGESIESALKAYAGAAHLPHDWGFGGRVMQTRSEMEQATGPSPHPEPAR